MRLSSRFKHNKIFSGLDDPTEYNMLIAYDLRSETADYSKITNFLDEQKAIKAINIQKSVWLLSTTMSPRAIFNALRLRTNEDDDFLVIELWGFDTYHNTNDDNVSKSIDEFINSNPTTKQLELMMEKIQTKLDAIKKSDEAN